MKPVLFGEASLKRFKQNFHNIATIFNSSIQFEHFALLNSLSISLIEILFVIFILESVTLRIRKLSKSSVLEFDNKNPKLANLLHFLEQQIGFDNFCLYKFEMWKYAIHSMFPEESYHYSNYLPANAEQNLKH